jgi:hypothetical protein
MMDERCRLRVRNVTNWFGCRPPKVPPSTWAGSFQQQTLRSVRPIVGRRLNRLLGFGRFPCARAKAHHVIPIFVVERAGDLYHRW